MSKFHKVKTHRWKNGVLETLWDFFEDFESAKVFAENVDDAHHVKVYTDDDQLVHSVQPVAASTNTYA
jgi:hypothetical protein